uniref:Glycosyltransferase family 92 protein n=1 Tax=Strongyloides stercoralis TaxID=6248 RepID=A0A0K0DWN2_STRER
MLKLIRKFFYILYLLIFYFLYLYIIKYSSNENSNNVLLLNNTQDNYSQFNETIESYLEKFKDYYYSKDVTNESVILLNFYLVLKEKSLGVFEFYLISNGFSRCVSSYLNRKKITFYMYDNKSKKIIPGYLRPTMKMCPWLWAIDCKWNSFFLKFVIPNNIAKSLDSVTIFNLYSKTKIDVVVKKPFLYKEKENFTVCVPPLYYFNNLLQLFIATEIWKLQGVTKILYYYVSASKDVINLLKYYESEGLVTIVPYKLLPKSQKEDPNINVYRYGHISAFNDCMNRINSKYATILDVDEIFYYNETYNINKNNFYELIDKIFQNNKTISTLIFKHYAATIELNDVKNNFKFLKKITYNSVRRPPKYIVKPERELTFENHIVSKLFKFKSPYINTLTGIYLHFRFNWAYNNKTKSNEINLISQENINILSKKFSEIKKKINFKGIFEFKLNILHEIGKCLKKWRKKGCKSIDKLCKDNVFHMEKWVTSDSMNTSDKIYLL